MMIFHTVSWSWSSSAAQQVLTPSNPSGDNVQINPATGISLYQPIRNASGFVETGS